MTEPQPFGIAEATLADMAAAMAAGRVTSEFLVRSYLERIARYDRQGPRLGSVLEVNPDALFIARALDRERQVSGLRGPLHGIPVLVKDNVSTRDCMHTSAGSLALADSYAPADAFLVRLLREAGAVLLGKSNMTEFANFLTRGMPAGYSSRGGQVVNPYLKDLSPSGSSSGSAVAVAANLAAAAVGTETSGSILSPANNNAIVGIKPTVGLVSRSGIIPIAMSQDTAGPMARTVADAALLLGAMTGIDHADAATLCSVGRAYKDYTQFLDAQGLRGTRIGVPRAYFCERLSDEEKPLFAAALEAVRSLGAELVDPADITTAATGPWDSNVMVYEFKPALNAYLASLGPGASVKSLKEIIAFNNAHPEAMLKYGQTLAAAAEATSGTLTEPEYLLDRLQDIRLAATEGIDAVMEKERLDALLFPGSWGAWIGARAGYPGINVPAGFTAAGQPLGVTFLARAWSEPQLIRYAYAFEQGTRHRRPPNLEA